MIGLKLIGEIRSVFRTYRYVVFFQICKAHIGKSSGLSNMYFVLSNIMGKQCVFCVALLSMQTLSN